MAQGTDWTVRSCGKACSLANVECRVWSKSKAATLASTYTVVHMRKDTKLYVTYNEQHPTSTKDSACNKF